MRKLRLLLIEIFWALLAEVKIYFKELYLELKVKVPEFFKEVKVVLFIMGVIAFILISVIFPPVFFIVVIIMCFLCGEGSNYEIER